MPLKCTVSEIHACFFWWRHLGLLYSMNMVFWQKSFSVRITLLEKFVISFFVILDLIISKEEYLEYQKDSYKKLLGMEMPGYRVTIEEQNFKEMDRDDTGVIDWWEFMIAMCVKKLTEKKKVIVWICYDDTKSWWDGRVGAGKGMHGRLEKMLTNDELASLSSMLGAIDF